ncbi:MAG TPA: SdpI family protein [Balneolaceae bacterium]|nr:SdpI family protein [Balneolaceae bacterium]
MKTLKYAFKKEWYNIILLMVPFIAIPFIWGHLPNTMATHWNAHGKVNGYNSKAFGVLFVPFLNIGIYLLLLYLPYIDPKKRIKTDQKPIPVLRTVIIAFLLAVHTWSVGVNLGMQISALQWIYPGIGLFLIIFGNYMRTIEPNYFIGIRVPWTLEDSRNWRQTHRMASYLWVVGGLLLIITFPLLSQKIYGDFFIAVVIVLALVPAIYSFYLFETES